MSSKKEVASRRRKRLQVLEKCNCRCAYCGENLYGESFHIDHIEPKNRNKGLISRHLACNPISGSDDISNLFPSCAGCNSSKSDLSIEEFRDRIYDRLVRLNNYSSEYRIAKRFGLVEEKEIDIVFYFETIQEYAC